MLTGAINVIPDARLQLWLGVVGNLIAWTWLILSKPFRSMLCNVVALAALLQLLLTYICAFLFLGDDSDARVDLRGWAGELLVVLNSVCFVVVAVGTARNAWRARRNIKARLLRSRKDSVEVEPPRIGSGKFHVFLSHTWAQGEDAARTIKLRLVEMMPKVAVFLDKVWRFHQAPCSCALLSDHTP